VYSYWRTITAVPAQRDAIMATFAERLKQLREKAGLTQAGLAQRSGLSLGIVRDYEQERKEPALRSAFKLADALGVDCSVFKDCFDEASASKRPRAGKDKSAERASKRRR